MSGTISYDYDPLQEVYVIHECNNKPYVVSGTVLRIRGSVLTSGTTVVYDVRVAGDVGTVEFESDDVFALIGDALTEYETRVL